MRLDSLDGGVKPRIVLLQTSSTRLEQFIKDKLKLKFMCNVDSELDISTRQDYKLIREVTGISPPFAERWLVTINLDRNNDKDLMNLIHQSSTCCFFCTCSHYGTYKKFLADVKNMQGVFDFYITYLRRVDLLYLYDAFVPLDNRLTKVLFDYVAQSYGNDIDKIFELLIHLNQGEKVESRKDITSICGSGGLSTESYIFQLLKPLGSTERGVKTTIRNRMKAGVDLGESLSFTTLYNYMARNIMLFIELKMLIISGVVYKTVRKLPDNFDERALSKYQKYIWQLKSIPMSDFLRLRECLGEKAWRTELDFTSFIYKYYAVRGANLLCQ